LSYLPESKVFRQTGYRQRFTNRASQYYANCDAAAQSHVARLGTDSTVAGTICIPAFLFIRSVVNRQ